MSLETSKARELIAGRVHELYWKYNVNCARTMLVCLGALFETPMERQTLEAALAMHGAGGYRAQCGLVEGALMFMGIYFYENGMTENEAVNRCYRFAESFERRFGSLRCKELRPGGFSRRDPPHLCEGLTCGAVEFAWDFIRSF